MSLPIEAIATAFSRHEFEKTYPSLRDDIRWNLVGGELLTGVDAVVQACEESAGYLSGVTTTFTRFRAIVGETAVVIESEAVYTERAGDTSVVASCDIYDFDDGKVSQITSYTVELTKR